MSELIKEERIIMETTIFFIISLIVMMAGLAGVILPFLPGLPLAWLGFLIFATLTNFEKISLVLVIIFLGLAILSFVLDLAIPLLGAKRYQASKFGMLGAFLGLLIGTIVFGFPGIVLGPLVGAVIGELIAKKPPEQAAKSALGAFVGFLAGSLIKIVLILIMMGFLIASLF